MQFFRDLWEHDRAAVIVLVVAILAILYYVYSQNQGKGLGSAVAPDATGNAPNSETPSVVTDQLSTILGALGQLTPVTNTLQPINTVTNNTTTNNAAPLTATLTTPPVTVTSIQNVVAGIGNDTARDAAIKVAEAKYAGPSNAAALQAAIAAILKQYPRSGPTT
jgi:hypothetical protein